MTNITRRNFLKVGAAGTATAILAGCGGSDTERYVELQPYVNAPLEQIAGLPSWYASTCRQCSGGCGIIARVMNGRAVKLEGNPEHPVNRGRLCARGQAGLQILYNPDRLAGAVRQDERGSRDYSPIQWNEAINTLIQRLGESGGGVGVWLGSTTSGHLVDLFTRFTDALGAEAPVIYDLYSAVNGQAVLTGVSESLLGRAALPTYDVCNADTILSFGADFVGTWFSTTGYNVEYARFRSQPSGKRGYLVQFEPRMSNTGAVADRWVPVRPGTEALVAQAIARLIADSNLGERSERAAAIAGDIDITSAAEASDIKVEVLTELANLFGTAERPLAIPGSALAGQNDAAVAAVQALNVIVGNIGQPGGVSLPPELPEGNFVTPAVSSIADVRGLIDRMNAGEIQVLLVHNANPAYELPEDYGFVAALENVSLVVSFASIVDETAVQADLVLPDRTYLESWGYQVASPTFAGLPVVGSQQPVVPPLHDVMATGDVLLAIAKGIPATAGSLTWDDEVAFIQEMIAALPAGAAGGEGAEILWSRFVQHGGWWPTTPPENAVEASVSGPIQAAAAQFDGEEGEYPYFLHPYLSVLLGDGSGANQPWLQGSPDPLTSISWQTWVEMNPKTAEELGVEFNDIVRVTSPYGEVSAPVYIFPAIRPDTIAIPFGQGHDAYGRYALERGSNPLQLIGANEERLAWSTVRVKVEKTDETKPLARFESTIHIVEEDDETSPHIPF